MLRRVLIFGLLCGSLAFAQAGHPSEIKIDVGWLAAIQQDNGWLVTNASSDFKGKRTIHAGDLLLKIDDHDVAKLGPLAIVRMLNEVPFRPVPVQLKHDGQTQTVAVFGEGVETDGTENGTRKPAPSYPTHILQKRDQPAPAFHLKDLAGRSYSLSQYQGHWLLLNVWGTWCPGCIEEIPALNYLGDHLQNRVTVLGVAMEDTRETLEKFFVKNQLSYAVPLGGSFDESFGRAYNLQIAPANVLISPDGTVTFVGTGRQSLKSAMEIVAHAEAH